MAFTDGIDVATGDAILASTTDNLADNTEWLRTYANVDHDFDITTGTGKHKTIQFLADSTYNVGSTLVRAANVYADSIGDTGQALAIAATTVSLPSGVVLDFNASDITITHSANTLTIAGMTSRLDLAAGILEMNDAIEWDTGVAVVAAEYSVGRDADATNQLHFNVPTGATFEWSVQDAAKFLMSTSAFYPATDSALNIGTTSLRLANVYTDSIGDSGQALALGSTHLTSAPTSADGQEWVSTGAITTGTARATSMAMRGATSIADDGTATFFGSRATHGVFLLMLDNSAGGGSGTSACLFCARCNSSANITILTQGGSATYAVTTSDVTGTTGVDGQVTISARQNILEVENRSGGAVHAALFWMASL